MGWNSYQYDRPTISVFGKKITGTITPVYDPNDVPAKPNNTYWERKEQLYRTKKKTLEAVFSLTSNDIQLACKKTYPVTRMDIDKFVEFVEGVKKKITDLGFSDLAVRMLSAKSEYYDEPAIFEFFGSREETDEEFQRRVSLEMQEDKLKNRTPEQIEKATRRRELKMLKKLLEKYGDQV